MPFVKSPTRNQEQLTSFFRNKIKRPVEEADLRNKYVVSRSADAFNINAQIIKDLYTADIVICDLSGEQANPNVMYELGMRLAFSNGPVILIRERHENNNNIFDVGGFYTELYDPLLDEISDYLIDKIRRLEESEEEEGEHSPVLTVLREEVPLLQRMSGRRAAHLLKHLALQLEKTQIGFGAAVVVHVSNSADVDFSHIVEDLATELTDKRDSLTSVPWSQLEVTPGNQPTIDAYIASPYLEGLLDDQVVEKFTSAIFTYYSRFLAADTLWQPPSLNIVTSFLSNSVSIQEMANALQEALVDPSAKTSAIERFETLASEFRGIGDGT